MPQTNARTDYREPIMVGRHFPELDGIRGIAIILVLIFHCSSIALPQTWATNLYIAVAGVGWVGVDLFFVLSGFLITAILIDTRNNPNFFRSFYARRILRIFPLYYVSLAVWTLASWLLPLQFLNKPAAISNLPYWLYLQNWLHLFGVTPPIVLIHFWSLAVEEQFYLIWPVLIHITARHGLVQDLCIGAIILAVTLRTALVLLGLTEVAFYFTFSRIDALAIGAYVAVLFHHSGTLADYRRAAAIALSGASGLVLVIVFQQHGLYNLNPVVLLISVFPLAILFGSFLIIALTTRQGGLLRILLENRTLRFVGEISYGIYVFHWPIMLFLKEIWPDATGNFWVTQALFLASVTTITIIVAYVSFRYFEAPILKIKYKFAPIETWYGRS